MKNHIRESVAQALQLVLNLKNNPSPKAARAYYRARARYERRHLWAYRMGILT